MQEPPGRGAPPAPLTVADAITLEQVSRWNPEVVCGHDRLDRPVRWVHVAEAADIAAMLIGDELLLTTGILLKGDEAAQRRYVEELVGAEIAALVLGFGRAFHEVPITLLRTARAMSLPLIVFRGPVPFVQMTEAIQLRLLDERTYAAISSEALRDQILPTILQGTPLQGTTDELAMFLKCSVVVESVSGSVLAASGEGVAEILRDWSRLSGEFAASPNEAVVRHPSGAVSATLANNGRRWGRLVFIGNPGPLGHTEMLARRSAEALAFQHRFSASEATTEVEQADALIGHLMAGSLSADRVRVLARVSGLPTGGRVFLPLMISVMGGPHGATPATGPRRRPDTGEAIRATIEAVRVERHLPGLVGSLRGHRIPMILSLASNEHHERALNLFGEAVYERLLHKGFEVSIAGGIECGKVEELTAGFARAAHVADAFEDDPQGARILSPRDIRLRGLVQLLSDNDDMQTFANRQLGPILGSPELLSVLSQYLATSMNKAATAQLCHLSRPALYRRLEQITSLLGVDLDDMEQVSALYVALLAHNAQVKHNAQAKKPSDP